MFDDSSFGPVLPPRELLQRRVTQLELEKREFAQNWVL